jgi:hypothetical protein
MAHNVITNDYHIYKVDIQLKGQVNDLLLFKNLPVLILSYCKIV